MAGVYGVTSCGSSACFVIINISDTFYTLGTDLGLKVALNM